MTLKNCKSRTVAEFTRMNLHIQYNSKCRGRNKYLPTCDDCKTQFQIFRTMLLITDNILQQRKSFTQINILHLAYYVCP